MLWVGDDDSSKWRYKRRNTVLGLWHQIKKEMYERYVDAAYGPCPEPNDVPF